MISTYHNDDMRVVANEANKHETKLVVVSDNKKKHARSGCQRSNAIGLLA
jgi:hypothetical protein